MTTPNHSTETSVTISLAELTRIEHDRVKREEAERAQARAERLRRERETETARRTQAQALVAAEEETRARKAREEAIEKARIEARELAMADVARIEAEAKLQLAADNAVRAHELNQLRVRRETGRRRREYVLGAALALAACAGAVATYSTTARSRELERTAAELRDRERALAGERDDARRTELLALDRRHAVLLSRTAAAEANDSRKTAEEARRAIGERAPGHERLRVFADALDALETRVETIEQLEALDRRHADLLAWAASTRQSGVVDATRRAAAATKAPGAGPEAVTAYRAALDQARGKLAQRGGPGRPRPAAETRPSQGTCHADDPSCGLDGRPIF